MINVKSENMPDLGLLGDEKSPSHLSTLINRVKEDEQQFNYATKDHLVNLAEYILSWPGKYSKNEYDEAIKILAKYHLAHLASRKHGWKLIAKEISRPYERRCARCGYPISSKISLATGYGAVCRRKLGITKNNTKQEA
jgi:hypothetical protein